MIDHPGGPPPDATSDAPTTPTNAPAVNANAFVVEDRDVETMLVELGALGQAWRDRGIDPRHIVEAIFLVGARMLCQARYPLREVVATVLRTWADLGGRA